MTTQAGKGSGKGVPKGGVAIRGLPKEKDMTKGVPDGDVAFRGSPAGNPRTAAARRGECDECEVWVRMAVHV